MTLRRFIAPLLAAALAASTTAAPALGQVQVTSLPPPDIFTTGLADTGLPADLWQGTSPELARQALNLIARKPLSPAAQALAYRLLATGAPAPEGAGSDLDLAGARADVLLSLGDPAGVNSLLDRAPNIQASARLSHAAAEAALYVGDEERACKLGEGLTQGRDDVYWLRLRTYCQARAGDTAGAELTFALAQAAGKDPVFTRLMNARLEGSAPGKASARNGLEYALSNALNLAPPPPPALAVTTGPPPAFNPAALLTPDLLAAAAGGTPEARKAAQGTVLILAALGAPLDAARRAEIAGYIVDSKAAPARLWALDLAAERGLKAETALVALVICAEAGPKGLPPADRARIIRALMRVGLKDDALRLALEGLPSA